MLQTKKAIINMLINSPSKSWTIDDLLDELNKVDDSITATDVRSVLLRLITSKHVSLTDDRKFQIVSTPVPKKDTTAQLEADAKLGKLARQLLKNYSFSLGDNDDHVALLKHVFKTAVGI